jgi:phage tail protein X/cell division protein FtsL
MIGRGCGWPCTLTQPRSGGGALQLDAAGKAVFHCRMKKIILSSALAVFAATAAWGQDSATQQQIDQLRGKIQDQADAIDAQNKVIMQLKKDVAELRDKVNAPQVNNSASADDLKSLAQQVQEIDKKRQSDRETILKEIEKLGSATGSGSGSGSGRGRRTVAPTTNTGGDEGSGSGTGTGTTATPPKGYYYQIQQGDMLSAIAKAYRDKGVKVTTSQILKANPGLDANKLIAGKKILIPDPNAPDAK